MDLIRRFDELGRGDLAVAGGKGANLGELARAGLPVPPGFVLTTDAYRGFVAESGIGADVLAIAATPGEEAADRIGKLFRSVPVPVEIAAPLLAARDELGAGPVAVRSSATAEDLEGASFAGQQETYLNVDGSDALLDAVRDCWASLWTARAMAYRARQGIAAEDVALAVVVQRMVDADAAGVLFTANPTNGRRDEAVVSAAWGLGESVVSGSVTTDDVVVDRPARRVLSRTTADKAVMTVYAEYGTAEQPVPAADRTRPVLDDAAVLELAELGARIEAHFGAPQDVEWARSEGAFAIVQARPITALPEPEGPVPTDWTVPKDSLFVRASIVEQLPDPLSTLFAELVDPSVTRSITAILQEFIGPNVVREGDINLPTVNGYAYYRYARSAFLRMTLQGTKALKVLRTDGPSSGLRRWSEMSHPRYVAAVAAWKDRPLDGRTDAELMAGVEELLDAGTEYYTAVQTIIPLAATSEVLLTRFYDRLVRRSGEPAASTLLLGYDSVPIRAEKALWDLAAWTRVQPALTEALLAAPAEVTARHLADGTPPEGVDPVVWQDWCARMREHLERFGHTVYNLDFVNALPADDPAPLLETLRFYLRGEGGDPYERQRKSAQRRDELEAEVAARLDPLRRKTFTRLCHWAQRAAPVREDALADVGLAWPQLRRMLRELGSRLVAAGVIAQPDDVFWLRRAEILGDRAARLDGTVAQRRAVWRGQRRATPPQILPVGTVWDRFESFMPAVSTQQTGNVLKGTGASAGRVTAPARVLSGPADFGRMQPGDVLVASITTPAWTSLFAMASAVVTDIGGPLSHSSIVAREYGIPAVLGTGVATRRITDGAVIHVDGDAGTVTLDGAEPEPPPTVATDWRRGIVAGAALAGVAVELARRVRRRRSR